MSRQHKIIPLGILAGRVFNAYGTHWDHTNADKMYDHQLRKCYDEGLLWFMDHMSKPENAGLLAKAGQKQLTEGD